MVPEPDYRQASESAREAFRDMKFGVRIHWGVYALWETAESWPLINYSNEQRQAYQQLYHRFNPTNFNADEWMALFQRAGLKVFAFTSKHHDGFSMFDTQTRVKRRVNWTAPGGPKLEDCDLAYSIAETPFRRDVVKELCDAARRRNLKIDLYFSHPDWYDADFRPYIYHPLQVPSSNVLTLDFATAKKRLGDRLVTVPDPTPEEVDRMVARHRAQLTELLSLEKSGKTDIEDQLAQLRATLATAESERDRLKGTAESAGAGAAAAQGKVSELTGQLEGEKRISARALAQVEVLNQQIAALRRQLAALEQTLDAAEKKDKGSQSRITELGQRLNLALAERVNELKRYRSDFFGRLRDVLAGRPGSAAVDAAVVASIRSFGFCSTSRRTACANALRLGRRMAK